MWSTNMKRVHVAKNFNNNFKFELIRVIVVIKHVKE